MLHQHLHSQHYFYFIDGGKKRRHLRDLAKAQPPREAKRETELIGLFTNYSSRYSNSTGKFFLANVSSKYLPRFYYSTFTMVSKKINKD